MAPMESVIGRAASLGLPCEIAIFKNRNFGMEEHGATQLV
jgi:hypothetical protein